MNSNTSENVMQYPSGIVGIFFLFAQVGVDRPIAADTFFRLDAGVNVKLGVNRLKATDTQFHVLLTESHPT